MHSNQLVVDVEVVTVIHLFRVLLVLPSPVIILAQGWRTTPVVVVLIMLRVI
jgi:hypothetical protein